MNNTNQTDLLGKILEDLHFSGVLCLSGKFASPWGLQGSAIEFPVYHYVHKGECTVRLHVEEVDHSMATGDLVVLPHGHGHIISDGSGNNVLSLEEALPDFQQKRGQAQSRGEICFSEGPYSTYTHCGIFFIDKLVEIPLWQALPPIIHIKADKLQKSPWLLSFLHCMSQEAGSGLPGASIMSAKMSELIFLLAIRAFLTDETHSNSGWIYALKDQRVSQVLWLIHTEYAKPWTLETLAHRGGMSRTLLASIFKEYTGETPIQYLTATRIRNAVRMLRSDHMELKEIATAVGFRSIVGFHKAFKREKNTTPGAFRSMLQAS